MLFVNFKHEARHMAYRHVTEEESRSIYKWCQEGYGMRMIARFL